MKNSEEAIDRVLAGLQEVEIPAGLERRVMEGLEERSAQTRVRSRWFDLRGIPLSYAACGVALAGVLVLVLLVPAIRRPGNASVGEKAEVAPGMRSGMRAGNQAGLHAPVASSGMALVGSAASPGGHGGRRLNDRDDRSIAAPVRDLTADSATVDSEDSLAMSEMRAASFPAPKMPLTEQERLFLRMTRRVDAVELAVLDPHMRELEEAEDKAEFQRFFAKPATEQATPEAIAPEQTPPDVETPKQTLPDSLGMTQSTPQETTTKAQPTSADAPQ
jgi:hypothetical protein